MDNIERLRQEAYRRSELRLEAQQAFATAHDQRALILAGVSVAVSALVFEIAKEKYPSQYIILSSFSFLICAILSIFSAYPQSMYTSGSHFSDLENSVKMDKAYLRVLEELGNNNDVYINNNDNLAHRRANFYKCSIGAFILGIFFLAISFLEKAQPTNP